MNRNKIIALTIAASLTTSLLPANLTFALDGNEDVVKQESVKSTEVTVSKFTLNSVENYAQYEKDFKVTGIKGYSNNGGQYSSSSLDKAFDGNTSTHWETGKPNSDTFTNEIIVTFDNIEKINKIVYAARKDASNKGYATKFSIYASLTEDGEDFELVGTGNAARTSNLAEFKINTTNAKRIKFVFDEAYNSWASASEIMFFKEDQVLDKMETLFTDNTYSKVSEAFNSTKKIEKLTEEVKNHPLYSMFKEDLENAKNIIEKTSPEYVDAKVSTFINKDSKLLAKYDEEFKVSLEKITSITANGGHYGSNNIEKAIDGSFTVGWHSGKQNTDKFTNEVVMTLDELTEINRVIYTGNQGSFRGFAESFDIYVSTTTKGETFELVTSGTASKTKESIEIKFNKTEARRVKFVFKKGYENWALASEFGLYTEDKIDDKIDRLFTDSTMSAVSEEFNSLEKIDELAEEAKNHPLFENYQEDLANAKALIEQGKVEAKQAEISKFEPYYSSYIEEYDKAFRIGSERITNITNNGGQYASSGIKNAIDNDVNTHWETGTPNSASFKNEVNLTLDKAEFINRITYKSRNGGKGFAKNFSIYVSPTTKGDNFVKVTSGEYTVTSDLLEIKFNEIKARRIKFVFDNANEEWASIGDLRLYKADVVLEKINTLFTNGLNNEVSDEFNTLEKLAALENEVAGHPLENIFNEEIQMAKDIIMGQQQTTKIVVAEQHGDMASHASKNLKFGFGNNYQPTGIYAKPGETITVYVDADSNEPLPSLVFSQQEGSFANWTRSVSLHPGKNVITAPEIPTDKWYSKGVTKGGPLYILNPYTAEQQAKAPVLRFVDGHEFPFLTADTNEEEFKEFLIDYKARIDEDIKNNPDIKNRKIIDTFEFVSDHLVFTGTATGAYKAYIEQGVSPLATIESYNKYMENIFGYYGLDGSSEVNDPKYIRENVRLAQPFGYMYAAGGHIGVQSDVMTSLLVPFEDRGPSWGLTHEIGHKMDVNARLFGETTNNMIAMMSSVTYEKMDNRIPYEANIYKNVVEENLKSYRDQGFFERLGVFWQLEMYNDGYWARLNQMYRERAVQLNKEDEVNSRMQYLVEFSSEILNLDLSEYFARHGFEVNKDTKEKVSKYSKPSEKIWYLNNKAVGYEGNGFTQSASFTLNKKVDLANSSIELKFNVNKSDSENLLGYEIVKDGKVVAFTSTNSYKDTNVDFSSNSTYEVIPYAVDLSTAKAMTVNTYEPSLLVSEKVTIQMNEEFNPLDYVNAYDYKGNEITNISVDGNVDNTKQGKYTVKYSITNNDITLTKSLEVEVVSKYDHISDLKWVTATTEWGNIRKNSSLSLLVNGKVKKFAKGLGAHANAEIVYDLSDKNYDRFEAFVGVDRTIAEQNNSSIKFIFIADDVEVYNSGTMKWHDEAKYVNIDISEVKELKIIVNNADNGNTSDHGIIAETKLTSNNTKPTLNVENKMIKLGEEIDFSANISASDIEDGDLTSDIEIVSNNFVEGKIGKFETVYRVTDSDNNSVEKTSYVTVYEEITATKSKVAYLSNLEKYNEEYKVPVASVSNNGGNYGNSIIKYAVDNNRNIHWETGKPNSGSFKNEVVFDLGSVTEIDKITYAARNGGKGFATKFEVYISTESEGDNFRLATVGSYSGNINDVIEIDITKAEARRVKFKFVEANQDWASIGEMTFYKTDEVAEKITNSLFADQSKTVVSESYNTLEKLAALRTEVNAYPAFSLFQEDLNKAEEIIRASFPSIEVPKAITTKLGVKIDLAGQFTATDKEDGDITSKVEVTNNVNFNKTGKYEVIYTVSDNEGNISTAERTVYVTDFESYEYLSDVDWKSTNTSYTAVRKDISISGNALRLTGKDGKEVAYEKGLGVHSTSTITYDLTKDDYTNFSSYIGVDRRMYNTVGSVSFEVYLDGKKVYNSGLMNSKEPQKFIDLDITGAKEMKLVVTDGGNGNGSDHATFGDAKLYKVEEGIEVDRSELDSLMKLIKELNKDEYSSEDYNKMQSILEETEKSLADGYNQNEINELYNELKTNYDTLEKLVDLSEVVKFKDNTLRDLIKDTLNLSTNEITIGDMYKLTSFTSEKKLIESLEGMQYAKNLESIKIMYTEINDLSPLKDLKKLTDISIKNNYLVVGELKAQKGKITISDNIIDIDGEKITPSIIKIGNLNTTKTLEADKYLENGSICIDDAEFNDGVSSVIIQYEGSAGKYQIQTIYLYNK